MKFRRWSRNSRLIGNSCARGRIESQGRALCRGGRAVVGRTARRTRVRLLTALQCSEEMHFALLCIDLNR